MSTRVDLSFTEFMQKHGFQLAVEMYFHQHQVLPPIGISAWISAYQHQWQNKSVAIAIDEQLKTSELTTEQACLLLRKCHDTGRSRLTGRLNEILKREIAAAAAFPECWAIVIELSQIPEEEGLLTQLIRKMVGFAQSTADYITVFNYAVKLGFVPEIASLAVMSLSQQIEVKIENPAPA